MEHNLDVLIERAAKARKELKAASDVVQAAVVVRDTAEDIARDAQRALDRAIDDRIDELDPTGRMFQDIDGD